MADTLVKVVPYLIQGLELLKKVLAAAAAEGGYIDKAIEFLGKYTAE